MGRKKKIVRPKSGMARRLHGAIGDRNYSEIADSLGVDGNTIRRWCAGESEPSVSQAGEIARIVGCSLGWLAHGIGPERMNEDDVQFTMHPKLPIIGETGFMSEGGFIDWMVALDNQGLVNIHSDDMAPLFKAGRKVIIENAQGKELSTGDYVICVTRDAVKLRLVTAIDDDEITIYATGTGEGDKLRRDDASLFRVIGVMF